MSQSSYVKIAVNFKVILMILTSQSRRRVYFRTKISYFRGEDIADHLLAASEVLLPAYLLCKYRHILTERKLDQCFELLSRDR